MSKTKGVLYVLSVIVSVLTAKADACDFFANGKSDWKIILSSTPDPTEEYAAVELQTAIEKMSGFTLPIVKGGSFQDSNLIVLGTPQSNPAIKEKIMDLKLSEAIQQEIAVYTIDSNLYLAGNSSRAVLYSVYVFMQDVMGVQWLWPGDDGEFIPKYTSFKLSELAINKTPGFKYRGFHLVFNHVSDEFETWMTRNYINIMRSSPSHKKVLADRRKKGLHIMVSSHNVKLSKDIFKVHPEYFALVNGKRVPWQLCLSNPDVGQQITEKFRKMLKDNPEIEILSMFPSDNKHYCQCEKCASVDISTKWFDFFKKICATIKLDYPKLKFASIAYQGYKTLPETDLNWVEFIEYCQYDRCYVHNYDTSCKLNKDSVETINKWVDRKIPLGIYGYEFDIFKLHTNENIYLPMYSNILNQLRKLKELKIELVIPEVPLDNAKGDREASKQNRLGLYIYAQLMWNPDKSLEQLLDQWNKRAFGKLDKDMGQIQKEMMNMWDDADMHLTHYFYDAPDIAKKMLSQKKIAKVVTLFLSAKSKLASVEDAIERKRIAKNLAWEKTLFEQWIKARWAEVASSQHTINLLKTQDKAPRFAKLSGISGVTRTEIGMNWSNTRLNIKAVCKNTVDSVITSGDSIQIRIKNIHDYDCRYREITVNPDGIYKSFATPLSSELSSTWNLKLEVQTKVDTAGWTVEISIPFSKGFPKPKIDEIWLFSIIRSLPRGAGNTSYPAKANGKLDSFANLYFSGKDEINKRLLMFHPTQKTINKSTPLMKELTKDGWNYKFAHDPKAMPKDLSSYDVVCFYVPKDSLFGRDRIGKVTKELLKRGKVVIFSGYGKLPLDEYLKDPSCKMVGSGWKINSFPIKVTPGTWSTQPNNLLKIIKESTPPVWGYAPVQPEKWKVLATLQTLDDKVVPCLMVRSYEKGLLVVGGGNMGTGGGWALFGNLRPDSVRMLLNNLIEYNQKNHIQSSSKN